MSRKRSNRLPKRPPVHVTLDFTEPLGKYYPRVPVTDEEFERLADSEAGLRELISVALRAGIDPKTIFGVARCKDAGRHKLIANKSISQYSVCCMGGARGPQCIGCAYEGKTPEFGIDVKWCRECFNWVLL